MTYLIMRTPLGIYREGAQCQCLHRGHLFRRETSECFDLEPCARVCSSRARKAIAPHLADLRSHVSGDDNNPVRGSVSIDHDKSWQNASSDLRHATELLQRMTVSPGHGGHSP